MDLDGLSGEARALRAVGRWRWKGQAGVCTRAMGWRGRIQAVCLLAGMLAGGTARAELRFDVFLGYDGMVPAMGWFPVACEVFNDGPTFMATFEFYSGRNVQSDVRRMEVELPTGTLKRFIIPVHSPGIYSRNFSARLLDGRRVRAEVENIPVRNLDAWPVPLSAAVGNWIPELPDVKASGYGSNQKPMVARIQSALLSDNPIGLSGLATIYLNSERALELKPAQVQALLDWMLNGGNLIVSVRQITHLNGLPWLKGILPCSITGMAMKTNHARLQEWLVSDLDMSGLPMSFQHASRSRPAQRTTRTASSRTSSSTFDNPFAELKSDPVFEAAPMEVAGAAGVEGQVLAGTAEEPLMVTAERGRGQVTLLLFNPELKPFLNWSNRAFFWAKAVAMPPELLVPNRNYSRSYQSIDGVFGAMVDSRQVRKLPVGWLLLLLASYLVVIGPLDRYWLKRINRQMLTWLTFPAYVAFFSVLIYFIGYKLRAGETEWNEIHVVDALSGGGRNRLHGLTYASLYSPANARYALGNKTPYASFRGEYGTAEPGRSVIHQVGDGFAAQVSVPVWTSQLFVSNWWRENDPPLSFTVLHDGANISFQVANRSEVDCSGIWLVHEDRIYPLGAVAAGQSRQFHKTGGGQSLNTFVESNASKFNGAIAARRNPLGGNSWSQLDNFTHAAIAACFLDLIQLGTYLSPPGLDLTRELERGNAILLAWAPNYSPIEPLNEFKARRSHHDTLWRLVAPVPRP